MKLRAAGDTAVLVELDDNASVHRYARLVRDCFGARAQEVVPGHLTLLVVWNAGAGDPYELSQELAGLQLGDAGNQPGQETAAQPVRIPVQYDGPDLDEVATLAGLDVATVCELHSSSIYTAGFIGFSPGFAYLIGGDPRLDVPRRSSPRARVPAGAVAIAAGYAAVYPSEGPGGWQVIGHTDTKLFDLSWPQPALLAPGTRVTFEAASS